MSNRVLTQVRGILADFWKDPACEFPPLVRMKLMGQHLVLPNLLDPRPLGSLPAFVLDVVEKPRAPAKETAKAKEKPAPPASPPAPKAKWHALAGEVAEKMWGEGQTLPAGDIVMDMLLAPLHLSKEKVVLDLSAGLGGTLRRLSMRLHNLKGLEVDHEIALRGMDLSVKAGKAKQAPIEPFLTETFSMPAIYDCILAREMFYRVPDKGRLFYSIGAGIKLKGKAAFTDFIVEADKRAQPAIKAWQEADGNARPLSLAEMTEAWSKEGFEMKSEEDQTTFYRREIMTGLTRLMASLKGGPSPDAETKKVIIKEVELWVMRLAAMQQGMKFFRFHAVKT